MAVTLMLTLGVVGIAHYALNARQLTNRVLEENLTAHRTDAAVLTQLYQNAAGNPWTDVGELLNHVAARPGMQHVAVIAPDATVAAVGMAGHRPADAADGDSSGGADMQGDDAGHGADPPASAPSAAVAGSQHEPGMSGPPNELDSGNAGREPTVSLGGHPVPPLRGTLDAEHTATVQGVLTTGKPYGGTVGEGPTKQGVFAVPLDFAGMRHILLVVKDAGLINKQLADSRWLLILSLLLALLVALPLFYLLGGRALAARYAEVVRHSSRDGLTGLGNHRSFHEEIRRAVELARRHGQRLSLAFIDLDHFKQVNDSEGHQRGDTVLIQVAEILGQVRIEDRAFRVGGDEFAVLFPAIGAEGARIAAEKVRALVDIGVDVVTTSIGVAELDLSAPDADSLIDRADLAMYQAKDRGKNQVIVYTDHSEHPVTEPTLTS